MFVTLFGIVLLLQPCISVFEELSMIALQSSRLSYTVLSLATVIFSSDVQPLNAEAPILATLLPIDMLARFVHPLKALLPMFATLSPITTFVSPVQL